jgi:hypothetical protein
MGIHAYDAEGGSHHSVTPSEAKRRGLIFSVTTQFGMLDKPGLKVWFDNELAKAAFEQPPFDGESLKDFTRRVKSQRYSNTGGAAQLGTDIHKGIEDVLLGKSLDEISVGLRKYVEPAVDYFKGKNFKIVELEKVTVSLDHTFAGTVDVVAKTPSGNDIIMDWKSKKSSPGKSMAPYPENKWQLAAYCVSVFGEDRVNNHEIWAANAFISTTEVVDGLARFEVFSYKPEEVAVNWRVAKALFELYRLVNDYDPRLVTV